MPKEKQPKHESGSSNNNPYSNNKCANTFRPSTSRAASSRQSSPACSISSLSCGTGSSGIHSPTGSLCRAVSGNFDPLLQEPLDDPIKPTDEMTELPNQDMASTRSCQGCPALSLGTQSCVSEVSGIFTPPPQEPLNDRVGLIDEMSGLANQDKYPNYKPASDHKKKKTTKKVVIAQGSSGNKRRKKKKKKNRKDKLSTRNHSVSPTGSIAPRSCFAGPSTCDTRPQIWKYWTQTASASVNHPSDLVHMSNSAQENFRLRVLDENSYEFKDVLQYFRGNYYQSIIRIYSIENHFSNAEFMDRLEQARWSEQQFNTCNLFHDTDANNVLSICRHNFDERLARRFKYGPGVYFSVRPEYAYRHSSYKTDAIRAIFLVEVFVGKVYKEDTPLDRPYEWDTFVCNGGLTYRKNRKSEYVPRYVAIYWRRGI